MHLIIGHDECQNCNDAKNLLISRGDKYIYYDLKAHYNNWRQVFNDLKQLIDGQRSIPIIFEKIVNDGENEIEAEAESFNGVPLTVNALSSWKFIGTYNDLRSIEIDDNY